MKKKLNFVWIDDAPDRIKFAKNLEAALDVKVTFIDVKGISIDDQLKSLISDSEPDLIIMDHSLNDAISSTYKTGSTAASYIHEEWSDCPIISITGQDILNVDIRHRSAYENMFSILKISDYYDEIYSIALGFNQMKRKNIHNVTGLIDLLNPPNQETQTRPRRNKKCRHQCLSDFR